MLFQLENLTFLIKRRHSIRPKVTESIFLFLKKKHQACPENKTNILGIFKIEQAMKMGKNIKRHQWLLQMVKKKCQGDRGDNLLVRLVTSERDKLRKRKLWLT